MGSSGGGATGYATNAGSSRVLALQRTMLATMADVAMAGIVLGGCV